MFSQKWGGEAMLQTSDPWKTEMCDNLHFISPRSYSLIT